MDKSMEELDKLQAELRGIDIHKLTDTEYTEYKKKADRIAELIDILYKTERI